MWRALVPIVVVALLVIGLVVVLRGKSTAVSKKDLVRQLNAADTLINTLQFEAAEHVALDDNFARIVLDEIRQYENRERELR